MRDIKAIVFDCDGVLVDSEVISIHGERAALDEMGLSYAPEEYVRRFVGMHDKAFFEALVADYKNAFGQPPPPDFKERVLDGRRREAHRLAAIAGADAAMRDAASRGPIAVASSSRTEYLDGKLRRTGLFEIAAPHIYSADLVAHGKPAPDIFLYAAERIDADPSECLVLEDSENGVRAGVAAGMTVWGFLGGGHVYDGHGDRLLAAGADALISNFAVFRERIVAKGR